MGETIENTYTPSKKEIPGAGFKLFKAYVRFIFPGIYNRKTYVLGKENIPPKGALMIVSNHQNSLNDALALVMAVGERGGRKVRAITRADAFRPVVGKIFRWVGLMPAFRMQYDGAETLSNNAYSFSEASGEILKGGTVLIYPEAGHQDKHWLGSFTYGYLRILFDAAEQSGFEKEIYILPSCNHYEDYLGVQTDMLIRFGKPIALSPFYELYRTKPRTAQRQANALVRKQISNMMLDITDLNHYEAIDFIRNTYGVDYARERGFDPRKLPEKLEADKQLFAQLNKAHQAGSPQAEQAYAQAASLSSRLRKLGMAGTHFDKRPSGWSILWRGVLLAALSPLFFVAVLLNALIIFVPEYINRGIKDLMFHGTIRVILAVLATVPLTCILLLVAGLIALKSFWLALLPIVSLPILFIFAVYYYKSFTKLAGELKFKYYWAKGELNELAAARLRMYEILKELLRQR